MLRENVERYRRLVCERLGVSGYPYGHQVPRERLPHALCAVQLVVLRSGRPFPHLHMDESCALPPALYY